MNSVVQFKEPRLPYHDAINERYGVDKSSWKALTEAVFPLAKSVDSIVMALSYCRARKLDPFKKPVHIVPMWNSALRETVETVWPGIAELRTTAFRTGQYAGCDEAQFGNDIEETFTGKNHKNEERSVSVVYPEWCRMTVTRILNGHERRFVGPKVYWIESYARWAGDVPNDMWAKRPVGQLEKCAEAAALRRAFPEEIGNEYTAEEMEGQVILGTVNHVPPAPPKPPTPPKTSNDIQDVEFIDRGEPAQYDPAEQGLPSPPKRPSPPTPSRNGSPKPPAAEPTVAEAESPEALRERFKAAADAAKTHDELVDAWTTIVAPIEDNIFPPDHEDLCGIFRKREHAFE